MQKIILASQSPRRKELLALMGLKFEIVPSNFDEKLDDSRLPEAVAIDLAAGKASRVAELYPDSIVIGADTIVTVGGKQLEKPRHKAEAYEMLKLLAGKPHQVTTGLAVVCLADGTKLVDSDTTEVYFKLYDSEAVAAYVETGDPLDKAGAYGIQSGAAPLIDHIEGSYDTVVGLPTHLLVNMLAQLGINSKDVELEPPIKQISR